MPPIAESPLRILLRSGAAVGKCICASIPARTRWDPALSVSALTGALARRRAEVAAAEQAVLAGDLRIRYLRKEATKLRIEASRTWDAADRARRRIAATTKEREVLVALGLLLARDTDLALAEARVAACAAALDAARAERAAVRADGPRRTHTGVVSLRLLHLPSPRPHTEPEPVVAAQATSAAASGRRPGRPRGPNAIQSREEIVAVYRELWRSTGRRPHWTEVAVQLLVEVRTLTRARDQYGIVEREITLSDRVA